MSGVGGEALTRADASSPAMRERVGPSAGRGEGLATPRVTAVVLNYRLPDLALACVRSLLASDYPALRVLVVDNGSGDGSAERLRAELDPAVEIVASESNRYYAGGMNLGLARALEGDADYLLALNNDTLAAPDMVTWLVRCAQEHPRAAAVGPRITAAGRIWALGGHRRRAWPFARDLARGRPADWPLSEALRVDFLTGCALLIRREALEAIGSFDERYRMYYEDADWCARAAGRGWELWAEPRAQIEHLVGASARRQAAATIYLHTLNRLRFYRQHRPPLAWLGDLLIVGQEACRAGRDLMATRTDLAHARWRGLRQGWRL